MHRFADRMLLIVLVAAIGIMSIRLFAVSFPARAEKNDSIKGVSYLAHLEEQDVSNNESAVDAVRAKLEAQKKKNNEKSNKDNKQNKSKIDKKYLNADFPKAFKNTIISGDSLVKAIYEYGILDKKTVRAEIGAGTKYLSKITKKLVKAKPKYLVLHYGENEVGNKDYAELFVSKYKKCIQTLQKKLPDTKIFVDSIFPVLPKAYEEEPYLKNIRYYNSLIKKMAGELGVTYIDFNSGEYGMFDDESYYDADGVHPVRSFYTEQYLPYILMKAGIKLD